jgi:hypothetical protein
MKCAFAFAVVLVLSMGTMAQTAVPPGTVLPLRLSTSVDARRVKPGQTVVAQIMQRVSLPSGSLARGTKVLGQVVRVSTGDRAPATLALRFDRLLSAGGVVPMQTSLRAIASYMAVGEAEVPISGPDRGNANPWDWTTEQIGGDIVYRGGGPVVDPGGNAVGKPVDDGVLDVVEAQPGSRCSRDVAANEPPQAFWVFSAGACGVYGWYDIAIQHAGHSEPQGEIVLASSKPDLKLPSGTGLLLRVVAPAGGEARR